MNPLSHALLLGIVFLSTLKELTEACSCAPSHLQQHFCSSDIVIHAKVITKDIDSVKNPNGEIKYGIDLITVFKSSDKVKDIKSLYTPIESSTCGVELDAHNEAEYLITGYIINNKVRISLCGVHTPWKNLSGFQKKSLSRTYQLGCNCKIINCSSKSCDTRAKNECLWKDWVQEKTLDGKEALNNACIEGRHGTCSWYPGLPNKQPIFESHP